MDLATQLAGLDQFLATVFGTGASLEALLGSLGFDAAQLSTLRERHLSAIASQFIEVIHKRLTWEDKDLWFRLLARRYGLDGEPPASLEAAAVALGVDAPVRHVRAGAGAG